MSDEMTARWQFSLRTVLTATTLAGIAFAFAKLIGIEYTLQIVFVAASLILPWLLRGKLRRAYLATYAAMYGPFFAMATYALLFVDCSHCKLASWTMLPFGPGIVPVALLESALRFRIPYDWGHFTVSACVAATFVALLTWLIVNRGTWTRVLVLVPAVCLMSFFAYGLLALIRS